MAIIIDLIALAIIIAFFFIGRSRGFIKEIVSLVGFVLAIILAVVLSGVGAPLIYDNFVDDAITETVSESI